MFAAWVLCAVVYAADLGAQGLDVEVLATRDEVRSVVVDEDEKEFVDSPFPFMPEWSHYRVFSIKKGSA